MRSSVAPLRSGLLTAAAAAAAANYDDNNNIIVIIIVNITITRAAPKPTRLSCCRATAYDRNGRVSVCRREPHYRLAAMPGVPTAVSSAAAVLRDRLTGAAGAGQRGDGGR